MQALVPELDVSDLDASLVFYESVCGFAVRYARPAERFAYLEREGAELMLQEADGPGRRFRTAPLEHPFGRGVNLQVEIDDVMALYERCARDGIDIVIPMEDRWYDTDGGHEGSRQFVISDPDGYLLRFVTSLGIRGSV
jgi:catechol 2,3-dioxygenase-like lactoylglutathione lyase family enzyme